MAEEQLGSGSARRTYRAPAFRQRHGQPRRGVRKRLRGFFGLSSPAGRGKLGDGGESVGCKSVKDRAMRHIPRLAVFLLVVGLVLPVLAADEKKPDPKKDLDKHVNTEKTIKAGQLTGKILQIYESKKTLRLQVQIPQLNQGAVANYANYQQQYALALARGDRNGAANALRNMAVQEANLYTMQPKDVELTATEDVKVRLLYPPPQFDDKGKIKKYTPKELKELKGPDPKLPGYTGEFSDLQQDQIVQVTLVKKKGETPPVKPIGKKGKDADVELLKEELPPISLIVVDNSNNMGK
jgi:hypothetical protein